MRKAILYVVGALLCFYVDTLLTFISPIQIGQLKFIIVPHVVFLFLILLTVYRNTSTALILGILLGIMQDVYFGQIYGLYLFGYLISILIADKFLKPFYRDHAMVYCMILLGLVFLELFVATVYSILGFISFQLVQVFLLRLLPTIFLNAILLIFIYFFLDRKTKVNTSIDIK
ncbi:MULTISPECIES: rod shape-determining protein MreD [unclassified Staphylococcus]|uniref:rod shape-determining protein MreD n=1 Tax=unclassified Staphylococcus TaxID=91994 RepID=UPI0021D2FC11|nr:MULTISPECIES: rod shape-determining protein MreD [unclassified Staphylococcus]UXR70502.1 rod shape-determining protein MreD [Staphylococcus sp. IVB6246]UXR72567.1 rod shape-determining protein MreD [Staphylococcus sp. IVB6240]UXR77205.1 rod shape-determining protein MreD [Staphylococcus sp. IVB6233]UXR81329.1 rod shape-determining protein MreD [Staphylococcus sp. IVB6218]